MRLYVIRFLLGLTNIVVIMCIMPGTLIKMVYLSSDDNCSPDSQVKVSQEESNEISDGLMKCHTGKGTLHFLKFETSKIDDCLEFISSNQLCSHGIALLCSINF